MPTGLGDEQLWISATNDNTGTSTAFQDQSGQGNNGTAVGTLVVADTSEGGSYAFDFDGTGDHISVSGGVGTGTTDAFCLSFWWNWAGNGTDYVWDMDYTENNALSLLTKTSPSRLQAFARPDSDGSGNIYMGVSANTWTHIVYQRVAGSNQIKSYVNGVEFVVARTASDPITLGNDTTIGNSIAGTSLSAFEGMMDDIRWFNKSLTQPEITHLASQRGIEGPAPVGLGDEQLWLCPSLNDSANDISGSGNNGTYQGGMGTVADTSNGGSLAYDFDGVNDKISVANDASIQDLPAGDYSCSIWIKPTTSGGSGLGEFFNKGYETGAGWELMVRDVSGTTNAVQFSERFTSSNNFGWTTSNAITLNSWQHVSYTFEVATKTSKIYVNGVHVANHTDVNGSGTYPTDSANTLYVGARADNLRCFDGLIDDARIYNRTLTQSEITHLASQRGIEGPPPVGLGDEQLWLCPSLNDSANDISGNGNDGTYNGGMGTVLSDGKLAYDFDGTDDYIVNSSLDLRNLTAMSWSAWVKDTKATAVISTMFSFGKNGTSSYPDDIFFFQTSWSLFQINSGADGNGLAAVSKNQWQHVAIVFDGSGTGNSGRMLYFLNGVAVAMTYDYTVPASTSAITPYETRIGSYTGSPNGNYFQGLQDDVRVYHRALTQSEITHLSSQRGVEGPPPVGLGDEQLWLCPSINDSANDISGNGNDGTYQGNMGTIADTSNGGSRCYEFDGSNDYIDVVSSGVPAAAYSVSIWQYSTRGAVTTALNAGDGNDRTVNIDGVRAGASGDNHGHKSSGSSYWVNNSVTRSSATWYHYLLTYDGSELKLYVDGQLINSLASVPNTTYTETKCWIGQYLGNGFFFQGRMDDIRTYDRALTQSEITHLATSRGIEGSPSGPPAQYNAFLTHAFKQLFQTRLR